MPAVSERMFWICVECDFVVEGDEDVAHRHHFDSGCWTHWLYEFSMANSIWPYLPTGREIHASDCFDMYYLNPDHSLNSVFEAFARRRINNQLRMAIYPLAATSH